MAIDEPAAAMTKELTVTQLLPCPHCNGPGGKLYPSGGVVVSLAPRPCLYGCHRCQYGFATAELWNTRLSHTVEVERLREALESIADCSAFREQRFAEDDDADYFLRAQRKVIELARAALTAPAPLDETGGRL